MFYLLEENWEYRFSYRTQKISPALKLAKKSIKLSFSFRDLKYIAQI